jgi:acyl-[acyl-carrier-protein]-phospholipid O-acyltransferase / long-chain-fatty-acid--[acyl-carrier-protein] ligase
MTKNIVDSDTTFVGRDGELDGHLGWNAFRAMSRNRRREAVVDCASKPRSFNAGGILALSTLLADRLDKETSKPRVGIVLPPGIGAIIANFAVLFSGKSAVNINFSLGREALESSIERAEIDLILTAEKVRARLPEFPWPQRVLDVGETLKNTSKLRLAMRALLLAALPSSWAAAWLGIPRKGGRDEATLLFTSGSSGMPKGVVLSHRNILANCAQIRATELIPHGETLLGNLPVFHSFGFTISLCFCLIEGVRVVTVPSPLDVRSSLKAIREQGVTVLLGTPTFLRPYLRRAKDGDIDLIKYVIAGAEKTPDGFAEKWEKQANCVYLEGYGLTETSPVLCVNLPDNEQSKPRRRLGAVGKLLPGVTARVVHPESGEILSPSETGILHFRGPNVFEGYLEEPEKTAEVFDDDGWFMTGDLGSFDEDGFLRIEGRLSRFSKIGGEMVPHGRVEEAVTKVLGLKVGDQPTVAVGGRPDSTKGEALVLLSTIEIDLKDIHKQLSDSGLSNLWIPRELKLVSEIPMLPTGKLDLKAIAVLASDQ